MLSSATQQYAIVTANYWAFTITDGALRMLVLLYFYTQGFSPIELATLFLLYELLGIITNFVGGQIGSRVGLNRLMQLGLSLQIVSLGMLLAPSAWLSVVWVMVAQALSGIAKDLNKLSAKSSIKHLVSDQQDAKLFRWVALLTGSKNSLKGAGFFIGAGLLTWVGFQIAIMTLMSLLIAALILSSLFLASSRQNVPNKKPWHTFFSRLPEVNRLSLARVCLFAARDVWFVVALPVYLAQQLQWSHSQIGSFMAFWIIGYGVVQAQAPRWLTNTNRAEGARQLVVWSWWLVAGTAALFALTTLGQISASTLILGLGAFGVLFAINSALHSFLIVAYADRNDVSSDVGFYYAANAGGRLLGTFLSGLVYQIGGSWGLTACLLTATLLLSGAAIVSNKIISGDS